MEVAGAKPACKRADETADYVAFRDHLLPLVPDSAVMTRELFQEHISRTAKEVWGEFFTGFNEKYIAVQHRVLFGEEVKELARALDDVSIRAGNKSIVLFAAGTAPAMIPLLYTGK